jgi:hypothetical protein
MLQTATFFTTGINNLLKSGAVPWILRTRSILSDILPTKSVVRVPGSVKTNRLNFLVQESHLDCASRNWDSDFFLYSWYLPVLFYARRTNYDKGIEI